MSGDFHFLAADLAGYALATGLALLIYFAPAATLARLLEVLSPARDWRALGPPLAFAILPVVDALVIRLGSVWAGAGLRAALLIAAVFWARAFIPRASALAAAGILVWWLYLCAMYVDVDYRGALYQSVTALDLVKHAAVVREIGLGGLPLADPFFARPVAAGYYHYFYDGAAVIDLLGGDLVDARMAFAGVAFVCGIAFAALLRALVVEFGAWRGSSRRLTAFTLAACAIGGFDLVGIALRWGLLGTFERNPEWWDDEISLVPTSAVWVPHHLAAVIASFVALLLMIRAIESNRDPRGRLLATFAGVAMASAFGLSIWVTLGAAAVIALTPRFLEARDRLRWITAAAIAAAVAIVLSIPQMIDLAGGRAPGGSPLALSLREPARIGELTGYPVNPLLALALTPPVWLLEFGLLALGAWWFWRNPELGKRGGRLGRVLLASAVGGLLLNLLVRSAIINNDFGWRVAWFAALPAMIWTMTVIGRDPGERGPRIAVAGALALGLAVTAFAVVAGRTPAAALPRHSLAFINADPEIDLALRHAYEWAARHLPHRVLLQHNPVAAPRALGFGLYGRNPVMVADYEAELFGATERQVHGRAYFFGQIFLGRRPLSDAGDVHLVVTDRDRLWKALEPGDCIYRRPHVCITRKARP